MEKILKDAIASNARHTAIAARKITSGYFAPSAKGYASIKPMVVYVADARFTKTIN